MQLPWEAETPQVHPEGAGVLLEGCCDAAESSATYFQRLQAERSEGKESAESRGAAIRE